MANKFGFNIANLTQALLFGLLHGVMFFSLVGAIKAILILFFTSVIAWLMGYINEKFPMAQLFRVGLYIQFPICFLEFVRHFRNRLIK